MRLSVYGTWDEEGKRAKDRIVERKKNICVRRSFKMLFLFVWMDAATRPCHFGLNGLRASRAQSYVQLTPAISALRPGTEVLWAEVFSIRMRTMALS